MKPATGVKTPNSHQNKSDLPTILVIDDLLDNLFVFQKLIEKNLKTHRVLMTNNPSEGLKLASHHQPDAILLDFQMPEMNGVELCKKLKADKSLENIPVILITGNLITPKLKSEVIAAGPLNCLVKPIEMTELISTLQSVLKRKNSKINPKKPTQNVFRRLSNAKKIKDRFMRK